MRTSGSVIEQSIRHLAMGLSPGESRGGLLCPFCEGGRHNDKALSVTVTDDGDILYNCHRASCGVGGVVRAAPRASWQSGESPAETKPKPVQPPEPTRPLNDHEIGELYALYGLEYPILEGYNVEAYHDASLGHRIVIPIEGPSGPDLRGYLRGYEYRLLPPYERSDKTRHYRLSDGVWAGCFGVPSHGIIVVEDVWSALKIAQELPDFMGYSLMGSHMTIEHVLEINRFTKNWYLCLDKDASLKAIKFQQKYRHLGEFQIRLLEKDMKYLDQIDMVELLR